MGDSKYCLLVSQSLLEHGTFDINEYVLFDTATGEPSQAFKNPVSARKGLPYQLERHRKRLYYFFPTGSSILSVPFVAVSLPFHKAPAENGVYVEPNEIQLQLILGSALMACLAGFLYLTARLLLNHRDSIFITIAGALGTMVWSTASRGLSSHAWGIFLLAVIVYLLLKDRVDETFGRFREIGLATLLAWTYFIRPTFAISILGITIYYIYIKRRIPFAYLVTGAFWLILFLLYSHHLYDQWLPNYYLPGRINFRLDETFWDALSGVLISPSRGLLVFVPTVLACFYLVFKYRNFLPHRPLIVLAMAVIILHTILISSFRQWWGGYSYGPRLFIDVLPWFFLLGILAMKARSDAIGSRSVVTTPWMRRVESSAIFLLLFATLFIHGTGAWSMDAWRWNGRPTDIDKDPGRLWDWKNPQFLSIFCAEAQGK
jgi:hypothetical protein